MNAEKNTGRPTAFKKEYTELVYKYCLLGATDAQLAEFFNVSESTLNLWKQKQPKFLDALKRGKMQADAEIAHSLFQRAKGYSCKETHVSNYQGEITLTEIMKNYPPDTVACIFWLKNRNPKLWKDRVEVKEDININVFPAKEELDAIYEKALAQAAERDKMLIGRRERLGIVVEPDAP